MDKRDENKKEDFSKHKDDSGSIVITLKMVGQFFNGVWKIALLIVMFMSMSALFDIADMTYFAITGGGNPTANNNTSETSLTSTDWYKQRLYGKVDDVNKLFNLDYKNYIVYFRQDGCSYCAEAEAEIVKWLDAGNDSVVQIVFEIWLQILNFGVKMKIMCPLQILIISLFLVRLHSYIRKQMVLLKLVLGHNT